MSEITPRASAFDGLYVKLAAASFLLFVVAEAAYVTLSGLPTPAEPSLDITGYAVGRDFLTTWMGGRSILGYGPAAWFDPSVHNAALRVMLGPNLPEHSWSYLPHFILFTWPFGLLPYLAAYVAWCLLGIALYLLAALPFVRREHLLFAAAAPGLAVCVFFGQNGFYTAALLLGGLALLQRRQVAAGILLGALTVKPQLCILLPILLLLTGRWWAILSAVMTSGALVGVATYAFGPEVWTVFLAKIVPQQIGLLEHGGGIFWVMAASAFSGARLVGLPVAIAWYLQAAVSLAAVAAVIWTYRRKRDPMLSIALFVTATFLATPYVLNYDMVVFGCIVAMLLQRDDNEALDHWLGLAVWSLPVTMMLLGAVWVPLGPLLLMAFAGRLLWRLAKLEQQRKKTAGMSPSAEEPSNPEVSGRSSQNPAPAAQLA